MDKMYFESMLEEIYAAFNRSIPSENTAGYASLLRRVNDIDDPVPNEAAQDIAYKLCEYDSLPMNLGKAIRNEYYRWKVEHPSLTAKRQFCKICGHKLAKGSPGWLYAHDASGKNYLCKCPCNTWDSNMDAAVASKELFAERGWKFGVYVGPQGEKASQEAMELVKSAMAGARQPVRWQHVRELQNAEATMGF